MKKTRTDQDRPDYLDQLPTSEYVSIVTPFGDAAPTIERYPGDNYANDDLYERVLGGASTGGVLRIYNATGEEFTPSERRSARAGIKRDFLNGLMDAGDNTPWLFEMQYPGLDDGFENEDLDRVVIVEVHEAWDDDMIAEYPKPTFFS